VTIVVSHRRKGCCSGARSTRYACDWRVSANVWSRGTRPHEGSPTRSLTSASPGRRLAWRRSGGRLRAPAGARPSRNLIGPWPTHIPTPESIASRTRQFSTKYPRPSRFPDFREGPGPAGVFQRPTGHLAPAAQCVTAAGPRWRRPAPRRCRPAGRHRRKKIAHRVELLWRATMVRPSA
jgi:hypothetical protein